MDLKWLWVLIFEFPTSRGKKHNRYTDLKKSNFKLFSPYNFQQLDHFHRYSLFSTPLTIDILQTH